MRRGGSFAVGIFVFACSSPPSAVPASEVVAAPHTTVAVSDVDAAQMPLLCGSGGGPGRARAPVFVRLGDVTGIPERDHVTTMRTLRRRLSDLHACYQAEVAVRPATVGRITLAVVVAADGTVASANVIAQTTRAETRDDRTLEHCVRDALAATAFPARSDARAWHLVVPVVLEPSSE